MSEERTPGAASPREMQGAKGNGFPGQDSATSGATEGTKGATVWSAPFAKMPTAGKGSPWRTSSTVACHIKAKHADGFPMAGGAHRVASAFYWTSTLGVCWILDRAQWVVDLCGPGGVEFVMLGHHVGMAGCIWVPRASEASTVSSSHAAVSHWRTGAQV